MHPPHAAALHKRGRLIASSLFLSLFLPAFAFAFTPSGLLEIHQINVQQGDCTLLIGPDGTTVLIDGGNTGKGNGEVVPYLQSLGLLPADGLDYMINTHRDVDHLGGLDEVINAGYDVHIAVWDNGSDKTGVAISDFLNAAATTTAGPVTQIPLGTVIPLGSGASARCVAVKGDVLGFGSVAGALNNENDMSVAMLVQYGGFDYLTAGDLGGGDADNACTGRTTSQANVESPLAISLMPGGGASLLSPEGIEVLDVNHHGSESSTNSEFMNLLTPSVAAINVGPGQGSNYHHPRKDVVEKVLLAQASCVTAPAALVLQTEEGAPTGANTSFAGYCSGDIIVKTTGSGTFEVSGTGQVSAGPDERVAAGINPPANLPLDGPTDTTPPMVALSAPNGGELWDIGSVQQITWSASDNVGVTGIDLEYSTSGSGGPFTAIATGEANDGTYDWTVPGPVTSNAFVRVTARDGAGNSASDLSDAAFSLRDVAAPIVAVATPNGGEVWSVGSVHAITWTASDANGVSAVDLEYSATGAGGPFTTIATGETNDGTYDWTVPNDPTNNAFVRVTAWDPSNNSGSDLSDAAFTIDAAPQPAALVINEIMKDPSAVSDSRGEWFELYNPGATAVDINGWTIRDDGVDLHVVSDGGPLLVPADGYFVLGIDGKKNRNGRYTADYVYSSFLLANGADEVVLLDGQGSEVDRVNYGAGSPWPSPTGASMELISAGSDNNVGSSWATAVARGGTYTGNGDLGTPGGPNSVSGGAMLAGMSEIAPVLQVPAAPLAVELGPNQPNPFAGRTSLRFGVPRETRVSVTVFDARGRRVAVLVNETVSPGYHDVTWDGRGTDGSRAGSGLYFVRLLADGESLVRRVVLSP